MKGLSKGEVRDYFAAADLVVMTSTREGSPNAIKEALSMNKCIISTRVGDVEGLIQGVQGTWLVAFVANELATRIDYARAHHFSSSNGRLAIERLSAPKVAEQLKFLYFFILTSWRKTHNYFIVNISIMFVDIGISMVKHIVLSSPITVIATNNR